MTDPLINNNNNNDNNNNNSPLSQTYTLPHYFGTGQKDEKCAMPTVTRMNWVKFDTSAHLFAACVEFNIFCVVFYYIDFRGQSSVHVFFSYNLRKVRFFGTHLTEFYANILDLKRARFVHSKCMHKFFMHKNGKKLLYDVKFKKKFSFDSAQQTILNFTL